MGLHKAVIQRKSDVNFTVNQGSTNGSGNGMFFQGLSWFELRILIADTGLSLVGVSR